MPLRERIEKVVADGVSGSWPTHHIVQMILDQLAQPSKEIIDQGCVALKDKHYILQEAKYSGDRYELAKLKMKIRWRAMVKAIMAGM